MKNKALIKYGGPFDEEGLELIRRGFTELAGRSLEFDFVRDDSLVGGFVAYIDGHVYDASVSSQLTSLQRSFSSEGN